MDTRLQEEALQAASDIPIVILPPLRRQNPIGFRHIEAIDVKDAICEERELENVEFIPEPSLPHPLSIDSTIGHQEGWRSEVLGANACSSSLRPKRLRQRLISTGFF